ncbi:MAG: aminoacyl-tRNA hydrolase [Candidatus Buchananbacteria bacterium]|nr:aminoacyl-tRNA hydrolase [Candidatus Buchananbacteria bacterium]
MKLIVGLGNPGLKYKNTWHNLGWLALDAFFDSVEENFSKPKINKKFQAEITEGQINEEKIILVKPQTFMNNSGLAVQELVNFYKIEPADLWIIHDDIDLPLGKIRISVDASSGGHNGIKSIIQHLGRQDFVRFRIGIMQTENKLPTEKYVLEKINRVKEAQIAIEQTAQAIQTALDNNDIKKTMNQFN